MNANLESAIARLREKGEAFAEALVAEQALEDERSLLKEMAIRRIMERDKCSATAAKDIVRSDLEYMNHRIAQRDSVVRHYRAEAEFWAAKAEVTQASLITPDVFALSEEVNELLQANRARGRACDDARLLAGTRALEIEDLKAANADLVQANRDLAGQNDRLTREINSAVVGRA